jgi:tRNA (mo5U34)-methyltransferase
VLGIDSDERYLAQARLAAEVSGFADIEFRKLDVYDVGRLGERFDLVIFMGVLYHLRHPLLALDLIHEHVARDLLLYQSLQRGGAGLGQVDGDYGFEETAHFDAPDYPKLHFIEHAYTGDPTNWWAPNEAASAAMLRSAGFVIAAHPEAEIFLCRRGPAPWGAGPVYPSRGAQA